MSVGKSDFFSPAGLYVVFYLVVTSAFASVTVPYNALIADKSHPSQRGNSHIQMPPDVKQRMQRLK